MEEETHKYTKLNPAFKDQREHPLPVLDSLCGAGPNTISSDMRHAVIRVRISPVEQSGDKCWPTDFGPLQTGLTIPVKGQYNA